MTKLTNKQLQRRLYGFEAPSFALLAVNETTQRKREAFKINPYETYFDPALSELLINHASSFATPMIISLPIIGAVSDLDPKSRSGAGAVGTTMIFSGYEFYQADYTPSKIDTGDLGAIFLASALSYAVFSTKMPWNKSNKKQNTHEPTI